MFCVFTPMCHISDCHVHSVYVCTTEFINWIAVSINLSLLTYLYLFHPHAHRQANWVNSQPWPLRSPLSYNQGCGSAKRIWIQLTPWMQIRIWLLTLTRIRIRIRILLIKVMRTCHQWSSDPQGSIQSLHGRPRPLECWSGASFLL